MADPQPWAAPRTTEGAHHHPPWSPGVLGASLPILQDLDTPPSRGHASSGLLQFPGDVLGNSPGPLSAASVCVSPAGLQAAVGQQLPVLPGSESGPGEPQERGAKGPSSLPPHSRALCPWAPHIARLIQGKLDYAVVLGERRKWSMKAGSDRSKVTRMEETGGKARPRNAWPQSPSQSLQSPL